MFATDVVVTSSANPVPRRAIKLCFKECTKVGPEVAVEVLRYGDEVVGELRTELERGGDQLIKAKRLGDWDIGYLPRN
jgi:hypothetical protein